MLIIKTIKVLHLSNLDPRQQVSTGINLNYY